MKNLFITAACCTCSFATTAQTFDEWFVQNKTRLKYLKDQVSLLETMIEQTNSLYETAGKGISSIRDRSEADFDCFDDYMTWLRYADPVIQTDPECLTSLERESAALDQLQSVLSQNHEKPWLSKDERTVILLVYEWHFMQYLTYNFDLQSLLKDGKLSMTEGERLQTIRVVIESVKNDTKQLNNLLRDVKILFRERKQARSDIQLLQNIEP